jgi:hypothetical protein
MVENKTPQLAYPRPSSGITIGTNVNKPKCENKMYLNDDFLLGKNINHVGEHVEYCFAGYIPAYLHCDMFCFFVL